MSPERRPQAKAQKAAGKTVTVTAAGNFQISHGGKIAGPGESLEVPPEVADQWRQLGLVE